MDGIQEAAGTKFQLECKTVTGTPGTPSHASHPTPIELCEKQTPA